MRAPRVHTHTLARRRTEGERLVDSRWRQRPFERSQRRTQPLCRRRHLGARIFEDLVLVVEPCEFCHGGRARTGPKLKWGDIPLASASGAKISTTTTAANTGDLDGSRRNDTASAFLFSCRVQKKLSTTACRLQGERSTARLKIGSDLDRRLLKQRSGRGGWMATSKSAARRTMFERARRAGDRLRGESYHDNNLERALRSAQQSPRGQLDASSFLPESSLHNPLVES